MRTDPSAKTLEERHFVRHGKLLRRLLEVVDELLGEGQSYAGISIEQIIQRADISRSSFYRYFKDKNELLLGLSETALGDVPARMDQVWTPDATSTLEVLTETFVAMMMEFRPHANLLKAFAGAAAYDPQIEERYRQLFGAIEQAAAHHIEKGQREGVIRHEVSAGSVAAAMTWMGERALTQLLPNSDDKTLRKQLPGLAQVMWFTLYEGDKGTA